MWRQRRCRFSNESSDREHPCVTISPGKPALTEAQSTDSTCSTRLVVVVGVVIGAFIGPQVAGLEDVLRDFQKTIREHL